MQLTIISSFHPVLLRLKFTKMVTRETLLKEMKSSTWEDLLIQGREYKRSSRDTCRLRSPPAKLCLKSQGITVKSELFKRKVPNLNMCMVTITFLQIQMRIAKSACWASVASASWPSLKRECLGESTLGTTAGVIVSMGRSRWLETLGRWAKPNSQVTPILPKD